MLESDVENRGNSVKNQRAVSIECAVGVVLVTLLGCAQAAAQQAVDAPERLGHAVTLLGGGAVPAAGTLIKSSGALGVGYSQRIHRKVDAELNAEVLYDGRSNGGNNSGEGSFGSAGYLVHAGVMLWRSRGKAFAQYGGGLAFAHYKSQIGVYRPVCGLCDARDGWGAYAAGTLGRTLDKKNGVTPWFGLRASTDLLAVSGTFGNLNQFERRTTDGWISISGILSFTF